MEKEVEREEEPIIDPNFGSIHMYGGTYPSHEDPKINGGGRRGI
jgi:hypothetical protein